MMRAIVKESLEYGGSIHPLLIDSNLTGKLSLCNPSILELEKNSKYIINLRWVSYYLHHCENLEKYQTPWGPLCYVRPDDDPYLRTENYICDLDLPTMSVKNPRKINHSAFSEPEPWDFVGVEDIKLSYWNGDIYGSGVRRFSPNGKGRMQMCKLDISNKSAVEVERSFIEAPKHKDSYCEKNWMPILDQPFKFLKWCAPVEIVGIDKHSIDQDTGYCRSYVDKLNQNSFPDNGMEPRGGGQIIRYNNFYLGLVHEVDGWHNEKDDRDAFYCHRFMLWDEDWNLIRYSDRFTFMRGKIEFACGLANFQDNFLITFGFQDNSAILYKMPKTYLDKLLKI